MRLIKEVPSGCWEWQGSKLKSGYGSVAWYGEKPRVHRLFYSLWKGEIEPGLCVCHTCDNIICVNPEHLFLGTPADNVKDKVNKNRQAKGVATGRTKLTQEQVLEIYKTKGSARAIAKIYGISHNHVLYIKKNKTWKHLHKEPEQLESVRKRNPVDVSQDFG